jgi:hypothetical protein
MLSRGLLVASILTSPLLLGVPLILLNSINGMAVAFLTELRIHNATDEALFLTPLGTSGGGDKYGLPIYATRFPAWPSFRTGDFIIRPGEVRRIIYDADDARLSEFVVRSASAPNRLFVLARSRAIDAAGREYRISDLNALPLAAPEIGLTAGQARWDWALVQMLAVAIVPVAFFVAYRRAASRRGIEAGAGPPP